MTSSFADVPGLIILDTNVISELMAVSPAISVMEWAGSHSSRALYTTTVTAAEIFYGIELLPAGKRRDALMAGAERIFNVLLPGRVLAFDEAAARSFAAIAAARRKQGRPMAEFDAQIAAIAMVHKAALATRNTADFEGCGLRLVNPWRN